MTTDCYLDPRNNRAEVAYFVKGTEPKRYCNCHISVDYDAVDGGVVCGEEAREETTRVSLIRVNRRFPVPVTVTDAQYTYRRLPEGQPPSVEDGTPYFASVLPHWECYGFSHTETPYNRAAKRIDEEEPETANDPEEE